MDQEIGIELILRAQNRPEDFLAAQNLVRATVGVGPLRWDEDVAAYARNYVNQCRGDCTLVHWGGPYGENIAWSNHSLTGVAAVGMWLSQKFDYDYGSNTCALNKVCGQYTQLVWNNSVRVGCAITIGNNFETLVACGYDPPGNVVGELPYYVKP